MTASSRTGGQILVDQLLVHGVDHIFCVPGESYLAALDALHDASINVTVCRQEGGAAMMAEALWQAHRPARHLLRDARPRRHQCVARPAHRQAGFDADDPVRRPDRTRHARSRGVPGTRLPRRLRRHRQMGDGGGRSGAFPRDRLARLPCGHKRTSRPRRDRAARRRADRHGRGRRRATLHGASRRYPSAQQMDDVQTLLANARNPIALLGGSRWSEAAVRDFVAFAEAFELPVACTFRRQMLFPADHPSYAGDLGLGVNPKLLARIKDADLILMIGTPALGDRQPVLHVARHSSACARSWCMSIPIRANSAGSTARTSPSTLRRSHSRRRLPTSSLRGLRSGARAPRRRMPDYLAWSDPSKIRHPGRSSRWAK